MGGGSSSHAAAAAVRTKQANGNGGKGGSKPGSSDSNNSNASGRSSPDADAAQLLLLLARLMADREGNGGPKRDGDGATAQATRMVTENETLHELYKSKSYLGQGGFGIVVRGRHYMDQAWYAIKVIGFDRSDLGTVVREVRALACLPTHAHVVAYKGCWVENVDKIKDDGLRLKLRTLPCRRGSSLPDFILCIRLECCSGNLDHFMGGRNRKFFTSDSFKGPPTPADRVCLRDERSFNEVGHKTHKAIFIDILKGLAFLHQRSIIHRDLKPGNILFDKESMDFKITDFGLAKHFESAQEYMTNVGTYLYAAPEQISMKHYDQSADVYPLGLILFELLYPFNSNDDFVSNIKDLKSEGRLPPGLVSLHPSAAKLIRQMISETPSARPTVEHLLTRVDWKTV